MKKFTELVLSLEQAGQDDEKIEILRAYFKDTPAQDAGWALFLLLGWSSGPLINCQKLQKWATEAMGIPDWLFQESFEAVGDLAETIALLFPDSKSPKPQSLQIWAEQRLISLRSKNESEQREAVLADWKEMDSSQRLIWNKLLSGDFQPPVSQNLLITMLAKTYEIDEKVIAQRLAEKWEPTADFYRQLISRDTGDS
jgi:DNA ligase-1